MTDSVNPILEIGEHIFKMLVFDAAADSALALVFYYCPPLAIWPLKPIISGCVHLFTDKMFTFFKLGVDVGAIHELNRVKNDAYNQASERLYIIATDRGINSPEFLKAKEDEKRAFIRNGTYNQ